MVGTRDARAPEPDARERILVEATRLFALRGLDGTSLQDIADAVGMRKPSLLWHFRSKEDLHRAVLDALLSRWNDALPKLMRAAAREDRFDALLDGYCANPYMYWAGGGAVHTGSPSNPLDLVPTSE